MLKRIFMIIGLLAVVSTAQAQTYTTTNRQGVVMNGPMTDRAGRWDLGLHGAGVFADETDGMDDTYFVSGTTTYGWNSWFATGFEIGWHESDLEFNDDNLSAVPIFGNLILRAPNNGTPLVPYAQFGAGAIIWDVNDEGIDDIDVDASFAMKPAVGVDWFLNEHWAVNAEAAYVFTNEDIEVTTNSRSVDLDYWTAGAGLKYVF